MGAYLSSPLSNKQVSLGECKGLGLRWAVCSMQGWRLSMEDAHVVLYAKKVSKSVKCGISRLNLETSAALTAQHTNNHSNNGLLGIFKDAHPSRGSDPSSHAYVFLNTNFDERHTSIRQDEINDSTEHLNDDADNKRQDTSESTPNSGDKNSSSKSKKGGNLSRIKNLYSRKKQADLKLEHSGEEDSARLSMESKANGLDEYDSSDIQDADLCIFSVFDGHGGAHVSRFVAYHLQAALDCQSAFHREDFTTALRTAYLAIDEQLKYEESQEELSYLTSHTPQELYQQHISKTSGDITPMSYYSLAKNQDQSPKRNSTGDDKSTPCKQNSDVSEANETKHDFLPSPTAHSGDETYMSSLTIRPDMPKGRSLDASDGKRGKRSYSIAGMLDTFTKTFNIGKLFGRGVSAGGIASRSLANAAGCTAITAVITMSHIVVANVGDSRCVLCRGSDTIELSRDHKPQLAEERVRIYAAGGYLEMGRVNGNLNLSRALGDLMYKSDITLPPEKQIVSGAPDIVTIPRDHENDEFLIIGCDGIWELLSSAEVVDFVRRRIGRTADLYTILEDLFDSLLSPNPAMFEYGCDNMTAFIVDLKQGRTVQYSA